MYAKMEERKTYFYIGPLNLNTVLSFSWEEKVNTGKIVKIHCLETILNVIFSDEVGRVTRMPIDRALDVRFGLSTYLQKVRQLPGNVKFFCDGDEIDHTKTWNDMVIQNTMGDSMNEVNVDVMTNQTGGWIKQVCWSLEFHWLSQNGYGVSLGSCWYYVGTTLVFHWSILWIPIGQLISLGHVLFSHWIIIYGTQVTVMSLIPVGRIITVFFWTERTRNETGTLKCVFSFSYYSKFLNFF